MAEVRVTTKPDGFGRNWLEVGSFQTDAFGKRAWHKDRSLTQEHRLTVHREYAGRAGGEVINWLIQVPEGYPLSIAKITFDRINPMQVEILWSPDQESLQDQRTVRLQNIQRMLELAQGNAELTSLLHEFFDDELRQA